MENPEGANKAVDEFLTNNPDFAKDHKYTGNYKVSGNGNKLAASFNKVNRPGSGLNRNPSAKDSIVGRKSQGVPSRAGSTANLQGSSFANRPTGAFTGYDAARNRDLSANAAMYRRDLSRDLPLDSERHMMRQHEAAVNDFRHRSFGRGSPVREHIRSGSPIRRVVHAPAFSHYEAHRQQREDREMFEH